MRSNGTIARVILLILLCATMVAKGNGYLNISNVTASWFVRILSEIL